MLFIFSGLTTIAQRLYPAKMFIFYTSFVFFFALVYQLVFTHVLQNEALTPYLLLFLWTLLFYVFVSLFGGKGDDNGRKISFFSTALKKVKMWFLYFFIMIFIVLFIFSTFYTYKILKV